MTHITRAGEQKRRPSGQVKMHMRSLGIGAAFAAPPRRQTSRAAARASAPRYGDCLIASWRSDERRRSSA
eukprot:scaffold845_cov231-Pinguiococcus_pyrenoidosus.AAC.16